MVNEPVRIIQKFELYPKMLNQMGINMVEIHQEFLVLLLLKNKAGNHVHNRIKNFQYHFKKKQRLNKNINIEFKNKTNFDIETSE